MVVLSDLQTQTDSAKGLGVMASYGAVSPHGGGEQETLGDVDILTAPTGWYPEVVKPVLDRLAGALLLLVSLPLIVIAALLVRLRMGSPVLYVQMRVGQGGDLFRLYKLRTMTPDRRKRQTHFLGPERRRTHKSKEDPRVLPLGRFLRSWRLDELPQFWNVLKGEMSLVGPRPELPEIVASYEDWQHMRHRVKPGITGIWQISSSNGKPMHECTDLDIEYAANVTLMHDLSILLRTPLAMLTRKGY